MKKIILIFVTFVMTFVASESFAADKKESKKETITVDFITDIDCDHCVKKIMNYMPYQKGIKGVKVDLPKKVVSVSYDSSKSSNTNITSLFKNIDVKANVIPLKE